MGDFLGRGCNFSRDGIEHILETIQERPAGIQKGLNSIRLSVSAGWHQNSVNGPRKNKFACISVTCGATR
jgi:hypothetical protein